MKPTPELIPSNLPTFHFGHPDTCAYCGDPAPTRDHVIPVSFTRLTDRARRNVNGPMVWACASCNNALNARWFETFHARCEYANTRIALQAKPVIWHAWEIQGLDYGLQRYVRRDQAKRAWMSMRADWFGSRAFWLNLESLQWRLSEHEVNPFLSRFFKPTLDAIRSTIYAR